MNIIHITTQLCIDTSSVLSSSVDLVVHRYLGATSRITKYTSKRTYRIHRYGHSVYSISLNCGRHVFISEHITNTTTTTEKRQKKKRKRGGGGSSVYSGSGGYSATNACQQLWKPILISNRKHTHTDPHAHTPHNNKKLSPTKKKQRNIKEKKEWKKKSNREKRSVSSLLLLPFRCPLPILPCTHSTQHTHRAHKIEIILYSSLALHAVVVVARLVKFSLSLSPSGLCIIWNGLCVCVQYSRDEYATVGSASCVLYIYCELARYTQYYVLFSLVTVLLLCSI